MLRKVLLYGVPFLLPFALYALWLVASRRKAAAGQGWRAAPWGWLSGGGLILVILSFIAAALLSGHEVGGTYVPTRYIDGEVVPAETR